MELHSIVLPQVILNKIIGHYVDRMVIVGLIIDIIYITNLIKQESKFLNINL